EGKFEDLCDSAHVSSIYSLVECCKIFLGVRAAQTSGLSIQLTGSVRVRHYCQLLRCVTQQCLKFPLRYEPLIPVRVIPARKERCVQKKSTTSGSVASVVAAISKFHSVVCWARKAKRPRESGYWLRS